MHRLSTMAHSLRFNSALFWTHLTKRASPTLPPWWSPSLPPLQEDRSCRAVLWSPVLANSRELERFTGRLFVFQAFAVEHSRHEGKVMLLVVRQAGEEGTARMARMVENSQQCRPCPLPQHRATLSCRMPAYNPVHGTQHTVKAF